MPDDINIVPLDNSGGGGSGGGSGGSAGGSGSGSSGASTGSSSSSSGKADCLTQQVQVKTGDQTGTNGVLVSTPHVTQVRVPRRDDGKWMSIGAMIGTLIGKMVSKSLIKKAKDAEDKWLDLTNRLRERGIQEFGPHADRLLACNDVLWDKLCEYIKCGYEPDYDGLLSRARADSALVVESKKGEVCRTFDRYNVKPRLDLYCDLMRTEVMATVATTTTAREAERQLAWKAQGELLMKGASMFEAAYQGRIQLGADLMASAGENYAYLAESLRRTAEKDTADLAALGAALAVLLPILFGWGCDSKADCGCATDSGSSGGGGGGGTGP